MARAFWFSLLAGYLAGAFAAAIYLPRAILAPSLSNLLLLTLFSTVFTIVVTWRAWREKRESEPRPMQQADSDESGVFHNEMILDEPLDYSNAGAAAGLANLVIDDLGPVDLTEAKVQIEDDSTPARTSAAGRVHVRPGKAMQPELVCEAEPLVQLPHRRLSGRRIRSGLLDGTSTIDRRDMVARGLAVSSIIEFDLAVWRRTAGWLKRADPSLLQAPLLMLDLHLDALRNREIRRTVSETARLAAGRSIGLVIVADRPQRDALPSLKPASIGETVSFYLRQGSAPAPRGLADAGISGLVLDRSDLEPYLQLPLKDDPVFARLQELASGPLTLVMQGIHDEASLRDVLDYPCDAASGPLFGPCLPLADSSGHSSDSRNRHDAPSDSELGLDRLRGHAGYGMVSGLQNA